MCHVQQVAVRIVEVGDSLTQGMSVGGLINVPPAPTSRSAAASASVQ